MMPPPWPFLGCPVVTHLHGTELKMLDAIARAEPRMSGPYADWWASRMRDSARRAVATITISPHDRSQAVQLLGIDPETVYSIPNGVDIDHFIPPPSPERRRSHWLRWLVSEPQGWDEATSTPGSIRYTEAEVIDALLRCRDRRGAPGPDVRRPLSGVQTRPAAGSRLRPSTRADVGASAAGHLGRLAG